LISLLEKLACFPRFLRGFAAMVVLSVFLFLLDTYLVYWTAFPGLSGILEHLGVFSGNGKSKALEGAAVAGGWMQLVLFIASFCVVLWLVARSPGRPLDADARMYSAIAAYLVRFAFWAVFLVGVTDTLISFLRVEGFLSAIVGDHLTTQLGRSIFRGTWVHYPLVVLAAIIALFVRTAAFVWLSLMIVAAEFLIVVTRFVFSYEQAFQGDLVRFWYAGLFLFASAYTLLHDGHVRVDVLYANFTDRGKAVTNALGSLLLGLPLCWTILILSTASRGSIVVSPLLSFEISQSGFGMFTKYLMAAYLMVFAVSMAVQFVALFLDSMARFNPSHGPSRPGEAADARPVEA
jgi:TRAP-type mannitol/chloroaromatic compound transport system permease small subunit